MEVCKGAQSVSSNIEANDLGWGHLKLLIDTGLQVLVEQRLELLVLLVQQARLLDQILPVYQQLVVVAQRFIEGSPHGQLLVGEDLGH